MKEQKVNEITKEMTIDSIFSTFPEKAGLLSQIMSDFGLQCSGCQAATWETLESGVLRHGFSQETLDQLLERLNAALQRESNPNGITLTKCAAERVVSIAKDSGKYGQALRVTFSIQPGQNLEYLLEFSPALKDTDTQLFSQGIEIHVDLKELPTLLGLEIDFSEGAHGTGFRITNPNTPKRSCGCKKSQCC